MRLSFLQSLQLFLLQYSTKHLHVSCYHGKSCVPLESFQPVIQTSIKAMVLYGVYGRLHP